MPSYIIGIEGLGHELANHTTARLAELERECSADLEALKVKRITAKLRRGAIQTLLILGAGVLTVILVEGAGTVVGFVLAIGIVLLLGSHPGANEWFGRALGPEVSEIEEERDYVDCMLGYVRRELERRGFAHKAEQG